MTRSRYTLAMLVGASLGIAACTDLVDDGSNLPAPGTTTGSDDSTFDHDNNQISVWELIDRLTKDGPPSFTSRMHPCTRPRYQTLGNILRSVGIDTDSATELSAGELYREGGSAMGAPSYASRIRENIGITTSAASRLFDILVAGAPEIISAVPTLERCRIGDTGVQLFNGSTCVADGITCLIGVPAQPAHVELCNLTISRASKQENGQRLAVAVLMAAAYTCE